MFLHFREMDVVMYTATVLVHQIMEDMSQTLKCGG